MDNYSVFDLQKSLDTTTTNGNSVLDAVLLSKVISQYVRTQPVLFNVISHTPWTGSNIYSWDSITGDSGSSSVADGAAIPFTDITMTQNFVKHSYFYNLGNITNPAQQAASSLVNAMELRLSAGTRSLLRVINSALFNGDSTLNPTYIGLKAACMASSTYTIAGSGANVSHKLLDTMLITQLAAGYDTRNMTFVVSPKVYAYIKSSAYNNVRMVGINDKAVIGFAMSPYQSSLEYSGVPIVMDAFAGGNAIDTNDNVYLLSLAPEDLTIPMGQEISVDLDLLAPANIDAKPVRIKTYHSLAVRNPLAHVIAANVVIPTTPFV